MGFLKVVVTFIWELTTVTSPATNPFSYGYDRGQQPFSNPELDSPFNKPSRPGQARLSFPVDAISSSLICEYDLDPAVWEPCNTPENRLCWIRNMQTGENYTINTDCEHSCRRPGAFHQANTGADENATLVPPGIVREVSVIANTCICTANSFSNNFTS